MSRKIFRSLFILVLVIGLVAIQVPQSAHAAGPWYVVTTGDDSNDCLDPSSPCATINGAIGKAVDGDTIYIAMGTYTGTTADYMVVLINKSLTLSGGWDITFLDQNDYTTIDGTGRLQGVVVNSGVTATIERFRVQNASDAGIVNQGTLVLNSSIISGNTSPNRGGGLYNSGNLKLSNSLVSNNSADFGAGGIYNIDGSSLTLDNSTVSNNNAAGGGGIWNSGGVLNINSSTISGNTSQGGGGGIFNSSGNFGSRATMTINNSTITGNKSQNYYGGGIFNISNSTVILNDSTVNDNAAYSGGGIYNYNGNVSLNNSTVSENTTSVSGSGIRNLGLLSLRETTVMNNSATSNGVSGAGIANEGNTEMFNSSIVGNTSTNFGAGINNYGVFLIVNSTVSGNSPGGIINASTLELYNVTVSNNTSSYSGGGLYNFSVAKLQNTIIGGNFGSAGSPDCFGTLISAGYNLIQNTAGCTIIGDTTGNILGFDPMLDPLQDNGGPTLTHALLAGSPAIDTGNPVGCKDQDGNLLTTDQRGVARPQLSACDIGAYEFVATIEVSIDIKPGSETNPININSMGTTPVAILSTAEFDAPSMVDTTSLTFGKTGDENSLAFCNNEAEDVNEDDLPDLVCHFYTQSTGFQIGDTEGILKGLTVDGNPFEGIDSVIVVFASGKNEFVDVCHNPGPDEVTLNVPLSSVDSHAAHGDNIGYSCGTVIAQCTDGWTSTFTETEKTYVLEVDKDTLEGRSTRVWTVDRVDESLQVIVTSLTTGNNWLFNTPSCGTTSCGYLFSWYGGSIGEGTGVYKLEITQDQEGLVSLRCAD